jgi:peroxiredoxin
MLPARAELRIGQAAPAFTLRRLGSGRVSLPAYRGKVVLLSLWTPG